MADNTATIRMVIYDILGDLKQTYVDAALSPFKVYYWVCIFADRLRKLHVQKIDSGAYVSRFDNVPVRVDGVTGRNYVELPAAIYDFNADGGIAYISYPPSYGSTTLSPTTTYPPTVNPNSPPFTNISFTRTTPAKSARLYFRDEERPSVSNPYFYRLKERVYLLGVESINLTYVEMGLQLSLAPADLTVDIDKPFDFPQDLLGQLKYQILSLGRFVMQIPVDRINDGSAWESKNFPNQKLVSVNDQGQQNQDNTQD
jgi:hypothetical protein